MMNRKVAIYVPSTIKGNLPAKPELIEEWVRISKVALSRLFGGFTAYSAQGGWYSPEHGLIEEAVIIVQSFTNDEGLAKVGEIKEIARKMAKEMEQEAVSVEVDGTLNLISV